ncbi:MAG: dienelactone hydrolase family protein [Caulobacter sp.]|nr:dienelactone hydrolase family protein [Caulobacter sp.]
MDETLTIEAADGTFQALIVRPDDPGPAPVIVILQEIFGVNAGIRQIAAEYAVQGYIAVCPDLFWRFEPGLSLSEHTEANWKKGFDYYSRYDFDQGVDDIVRTVVAARTLTGASGKVGLTGYCLGGLLTFRAAARGAPDVAVAYYGGGTERYVGEGGGVTCPLLMHLAGDDEYIGKDARETIVSALGSKPNIEIHVYPGRNHAFARPGGDHYDEADAAAANGRTRDFFRTHLSA